MGIQLQPIGIIHSCFKEKFGIPRQPGLVPEAEATLELLPPWDREEALRGLEGFSHVWILFLFHGVRQQGWSPTVRPPRLGGNQRIGVFASRSPFRPNPIGLSAVELGPIQRRDGRLLLELRGVDLLDGTPVLDIKPYVVYADSIPDARSGFAQDQPETRLEVAFSQLAERQLAGREDGATTRRLIVGLLRTDPRPGYAGSAQEGRGYGIRLYDFDLRWQVQAGVVEVLELVPVKT